MYSGAKYGKTSTRGTSSSGPSTALAAVAFQDQLLKNLSLTNPIPKKRKPLTNPTPSWKKNVKSTLDTGLVRKPVTKKKAEEEEYVLDPKPPPPTLAQKLGLVEAPTGHLTEDDWRSVKERSNRRDDSKQPCVICKEHFGTDQQILLSCTHVFHRACLEAFERFTGKKTCPLCRKEQYQKRVIHEGARHFRQASATRIQATWRGYVVRKWYTNLRETIPPKDPKLRKKFYENKLKTITDRMVNSYDTDVNAFLRDIDRSLENSRQVFQHFDETLREISEDEWAAVQLKAVERGDEECPICLNALSGGDVTSRKASDVTKQDVTSQNAGHVMKPQPKGTGKSKTAAMTTLKKERAGPKGGVSREIGEKGDAVRDTPTARKTILLSCSHVYHQTCFEALEEYAVGERRFVCPVCRSNYQKKVL